MNKSISIRKSERGGAGVKALMILTMLGLAFNAGINYVPVAYDGATIKQEMQAIVVQSSSIPSARQSPLEVAKNRMNKLIAENDVPADTFVEVKQAKNVIQARVAYTKTINILPFGIYKYNYQFDHTAVPVGFLTKEAARMN